MIVRIREATEADRADWREMRCALWQEEHRESHDATITVILADGAWTAFIAETAEGTALGFAEIAIRKYANGCETQPVPFLEGIWVTETARRQGLGRSLLAHIERVLAARGFTELGSDTPLENRISQRAHQGWGFAETERVIYFRKTLAASRPS